MRESETDVVVRDEVCDMAKRGADGSAQASQLCEEEVAVITDAVSGARSITVSMEVYAAAELVVPTTAQ